MNAPIPARLSMMLMGLWAAIALTQAPAARGQAMAVPDAGAPVRLSPAQLDQLTAPVALYPDQLLANILAAATYPLEVVEAERWLALPPNAALRGGALTAALQAQSWDVSVKALVPFPEVLRMMNVNLEWTEQLGDAFLAQQGDVMDSVQRLRARASEAGALRSTPQETVAQQDGALTIEPAEPGTVYVPYYDPTIVYGGWPWPDDMPYEFPPPPDVTYEPDLLIGFGPPLAVIGPFWGWSRWDWPRRGLIVPRRSPLHPGEWGRWGHDPAHRRGVPYRDAATATRFLGAQAANRQAFRGYPPVEAVPPPAGPGRPSAGRVYTPLPTEARPAPAEGRPLPRAEPLVRSPPAFESFGSGEQVRTEAARGAESRGMSVPGGAVHGGEARGSGSQARGGSPHGGGAHR